MAAYFLVKSEPDTYSFEDLRRDGKTVWDGVRNFTARGHLKEMKLGDQVLFYHSGEGREVVGVAEVARESFPDPGDETGRFLAVELGYVRPLKAPVTLAALKAEPSLADLKMVRQGRLSVSPVTPGEWKAILRMAGE
ncbi:MAG: EVE domain-containing protein [Phenylobacterium sp.]|uniref:EVE domain-containing protein n=1 Tax=Phenylobacterium sp. TaxID=1871053 RepID=UPI001A48A45B|nr:EVE domain-containing protein [Phenylobacterium sp.]MBL8556910.1 EVE domain-containing protein [Phenylobacterium sp.]